MKLAGKKNNHNAINLLEQRGIKINKSLFENCTKLSQINIQYQMQDIGEKAFYNSKA